MVTEKTVIVREYRFRLVQKCKNALKGCLLEDETVKISGRGHSLSLDPTPMGCLLYTSPSPRD